MLLLARYGKFVKLPAVTEPPKVINAYVSVDLTKLPSLQKTQDKPLSDQPPEIVDEAKALPLREETPHSSPKQKRDVKVVEYSVSESQEVTTEVAKPDQAPEHSKITEVPFKKLNPYAPIPELKFENDSSNASLFGQVNAANSNSSVPVQLTVSDKAKVVWQNGDGSKRIEVLNGMCYGIDFNSVFGKSGVPSGSPRPCEDKDAKLFKEIMNKWSKN